MLTLQKKACYIQVIQISCMLQDLFHIKTTQLIFTLLIILLTIIIYRRIIKPYKIYRFYKQILTYNYQAQINPFTILGVSNLRKKQQELAKYNDSHHYAKHSLTKYHLRLMKVGNDIVIDLIDPTLIQEFFIKEKEKYYQKNLSHPSITSLMQIGGQGLFLSEGESWKKKKKILSNVFNFDFIHSQIHNIASITLQTLEEIGKRPQNASKQTISINIANCFQRIFGTVVIKCFFGNAKLDKLDGQQLFQYVQNLLELNRKRWQSPLAFLLGNHFYKFGLRKIDREVTSKAKAFFKFSEEIIDKIFQEVKENQGDAHMSKKAGIIEWVIRNNLICEEHQHQKLSEKYTRRELISEVATFFLAGTETTATMATMLVYALASHPEVLNKARSQIKEALGQINPSEIDEEILKKCPYLDCIIKQSLRMYSPVSVLGLRQAVKEHYLGEIPIRKGIQVTAKIVTNHYKGQFYKNPFEFNPDRWLNVQIHKLPPLSYFPFSTGQRACIGQHLSQLQAKIALAILLSRFKRIELEKASFRLWERAVYGPEPMTTYLTKEAE